MEEQESIIHIFWTGGWDSSFRLMELLLTTEQVVQTHYIIRYEDSTGIEIDTMIKLRRAIIRNYRQVESRFLPTIYINESLITRYLDLDEQIEKLRETSQVNEQYQLMVNYCREAGIDKVEVSLDDSEDEPLDEWLEVHFQNSPVFDCFTYPLSTRTKSDMHQIALEQGWEKILLQTSFCRRPPKLSPCGVCGPCTDAVLAGMAFRLPWRARVRARLTIPLRNWWRKNYTRQQDNWFLRFVKRKLVGKF